MMKKHFKYIDTFRAILCLAVLLYHLNLLKGGYLAVCCFFVLSGYLTTNSLLNKEKINLKNYYISRFKKLYLPLLTVVFLSIAIISIQKDIVWVSLKPETTSVLFGYNNFWQINANQDYFANHSDSPFMHLWYIAILIQFDLIYPLFFLLINQTKKLSKYIPSIIFSFITVGFTVFFLIYSDKSTMTNVYYNSFSRLFSLLFGVTTCQIHHIIAFKTEKKEKAITAFYYLCLLLLIGSFILVDANQETFAPTMILISIFSCIIIECAISVNPDKYTFIDKLLKLISDNSYEIYLVQYPIIYLFKTAFQFYDSILFNSLIITIITILVAFIIHYALYKNKGKKVIQIILCILLIIPCIFGCYKYITSEDHTEEMKQLEEQLAANAAEIEKQKAEYAKKMQEENDAWEKLLSQLDPSEEEIKETVSQLPIVFIGDSVMLGASSNLQETFQNCYVDAAISRTGWAMNSIIQSLTIDGPVVIHAGTNGDVPEYVKDQIMEKCGNNDVFWITVTNDANVHVNEKLSNFVKKYDNAHLIDWQQYSQAHPEWFYSDGIHLPEEGRKAYCQLIFDSIYQLKVKQIEDIKQQAVKEHEDKIKNKISFYGNDLLMSIYDSLLNQYPNADFSLGNDIQLNDIIDKLTQAKQEDILTNKIVILLDRSTKLKETDFQKINQICEGKQLYIITQEDYSFDTISIESLLDDNPDYLYADKTHLTDEGNKALLDLLIQLLQNDSIQTNITQNQ